MNIVVLGLSHLGCVTAACCARHFQVTGLAFEANVLEGLRKGKAPVQEPGLDELVRMGLEAGSLAFSADAREACRDADVLWLCQDTPVDEDGRSDAGKVLDMLRLALPNLRAGTAVIISSQLPVGTCAVLEREFPEFCFACSPENLRIGEAIHAFSHADRIIVGLRDEGVRPLLERLLAPFASKILFLRTESAEMVKHAINAFLATSIAFINEIALLCEAVGADAGEVSLGLKSDRRIGPGAYLAPGGPFSGGTLARDVTTLITVASEQSIPLDLIPAIRKSNDRHGQWALNLLKTSLGSLSGKKIALLGLTYKPGADTTGGSAAGRLAQDLSDAGAEVTAYDPMIRDASAATVPGVLCGSIGESLKDADAAVICTGHPEFHSGNWSLRVASMKNPIVMDAGGFLELELRGIPTLVYHSVGKS